MNTKKLIELTTRYKDVESQMENLKTEKSEIESQIEMLIEGKISKQQAPVSRRAKDGQKTLPSAKKKRRSRRGYKRHTPAGEEIAAFESLILEHFKKNSDTEISCGDLYDLIGAPSDLDKSRIRAACTRLKKSRFIAKVSRGVYVCQKHRSSNSRATDDEEAIIKAMDPGKPMRSKEILSRINPPSYRYHALENRLWMMSQAGKLRHVERGTYMLVSN